MVNGSLLIVSSEHVVLHVVVLFCSCYWDCTILSAALKRIYCANQSRTVESSMSLGPPHEAHNPSMSADFPIKAEENTHICVLMPCVRKPLIRQP